MKHILKIIFTTLIALSLFSNGISSNFTTNAANENETNLKTGGVNFSTSNASVERNNHLKNLENSQTDYSIGEGGQKGIYNVIIRVSRDLKNVFFVIAGIYFLILVIRLVFSNKTEEEVSNFKKGIVRISIGIIVTQIAYGFVNVLFDKKINSTLASNFSKDILGPLIELLHTAVGFIFIAIMIYAFFRIVTANGDDEKAKSGKMSVLYAIIGFVTVRISYALVNSTYLKMNCSSIFGGSCDVSSNLGGFADIIVRIINWMNSFIGLLVILLIIYAGFLTFTSAGDEEKLKKTKNIIIYIAIGLLVLVTNYLILTFFIYPETTI